MRMSVPVMWRFSGSHRCSTCFATPRLNHQPDRNLSRRTPRVPDTVLKTRLRVRRRRSRGRDFIHEDVVLRRPCRHALAKKRIPALAAQYAE